MRAGRSFLALAVILLTACEAKVPAVTLAVDKKLDVNLGAVSNVVEIAGGKVAFADPMGRRFLTADLAAGTVDSFGVVVDSLPYDAPAQLYRRPGWVALLAADTVAVVDFGGPRTTLWTPAGFTGVLSLPEVGGRTPVLIYDTLGHGYKVDYRTVTGGADPGTAMQKDSLPVLRIALQGHAIDTVARLSVPELGQAQFGPQAQTVAKIYGPTDIFGSLPDGSVWVARARTMSVDRRAADGSWTRGATNRYASIRVTEDDKKKVMERLHERGLPRNVEVSFPFADTKPSFEGALGRPNGEVWLQYSRASEEDPITFAVIGTSGALVRKVTLPVGVIVTSVSDQYAYGSQKNGDARNLVRLPIPQ